MYACVSVCVGVWMMVCGVIAGMWSVLVCVSGVVWGSVGYGMGFVDAKM